jgi:hypothetical protein
MPSRRPTHQDHLQSVLRELEERDVDTRAMLNQYARTVDDNDHETDSPCPIFTRIYTDGGSEGVRRLTNFSVREIGLLWTSVKTHVARYWNVGRGRRSQFSGKDVLLMMLTVLKVGGTWDSLAHIFMLKTPTFIKTITSFVRVVHPKLVDDQISKRADDEKMHRLVTSGRAFVHYPCALYATDVTFQQANRPGGNMAEAMPYYSAKHKLYGYKVEVSVSPRGFAINCTDHARGNKSDITMFRDNSEFHQAMRAKTDRDRGVLDDGPMSELYPDEWAVLADKGYQGLAEHMRCIHPQKGSHLSADAERRNKNISTDRIIVENYFGRLCGLWRICADKYRWSEDLYDDIFHVCASLTNFHIAFHPLRDVSGEEYAQRQNRLLAIGEKSQQKRRLAQEKHRRLKRLRHRMSLDDHPSHNDSGDDDRETQLSD